MPRMEKWKYAIRKKSRRYYGMEKLLNALISQQCARHFLFGAVVRTMGHDVTEF